MPKRKIEMIPSKKNKGKRRMGGGQYLSRTNFPSLYFWLLSCAAS
jgi:hypothetical protein